MTAINRTAIAILGLFTGLILGSQVLISLSQPSRPTQSAQPAQQTDKGDL